MDIYADPTYSMAIESDLRQRILHPKRAMAVTLPVYRVLAAKKLRGLFP